eukprot:888971-Amphidinium_carterae.1
MSTTFAVLLALAPLTTVGPAIAPSERPKAMFQIALEAACSLHNCTQVIVPSKLDELSMSEERLAIMIPNLVPER